MPEALSLLLPLRKWKKNRFRNHATLPLSLALLSCRNYSTSDTAMKLHYRFLYKITHTEKLEMLFWLNSLVLLWKYGVVVFLDVEKLNLDDSRIRFHQHTPNRLTVCQPDQTFFADTFVQHAHPVSAFSSCCKNMAMHMLLQRLQLMEGNSHPASNPKSCTNYRAHFKGMLWISPRAWNTCGWISFKGALIFQDECWNSGWLGSGLK